MKTTIRLFALIPILLLQACTIAHFNLRDELNHPEPQNKRIRTITYHVSVKACSVFNTRIRECTDSDLECIRARYCKATQEVFDRATISATCVTNVENASFLIDINMAPFRGALEQEYCTGLTFGLIPSWGTRSNECVYTFENIGAKPSHSYHLDQISYNHLLLFPAFWVNLLTLDESRFYKRALNNYLLSTVPAREKSLDK